MNRVELTGLGVSLAQATENIRLYDQYVKTLGRGPMVHVPNAGSGLWFAYEQLRNASENIESHLLFQRAILRFYKRNLSFSSRKELNNFGYELIIELTQAEYLENDTVPTTTADELNALIKSFYETYWKLTKKSTVSREMAQRWVLELLSIRTEQLFHHSPIRLLSFAHIAHGHFTKLISIKDMVVDEEVIDEADYPTLLYISIHKALLKSDDANIRNALLDVYAIKHTNIKSFIAFNKKYDELSNLKTTTRVSRLINRNGAPLRILRSAFLGKADENHPIDIHREAEVIKKLEAQIDIDYRQVKKNINVGIVKSIIFLLITKALVGILIEIPYDILVMGYIAILPLVINLLFPPLFITITALTFQLPTSANKKALVEYLKTALYDVDFQQPSIRPNQSTRGNYAFNFIYVVMFVAVFYFVATKLADLEFNIVQGLIFFVFLSTASFLGYRLTLQMKELELLTSTQDILGLIRDFLYAPFIFVGQRISYRFARMNIIAQILDVVIELPLKTILRLVRQWTIFLNNKKDELL